MPRRFTFNDEKQKNSYGFKVATNGIVLTRFEGNPICLNNHSNNTKDVLGKWLDVRVEDGKLSGMPNFDTEDHEGKEVVRKVENGTIKGCSMGIFFDPEDLVLIDGELWLLKCELYEVSIVAVPSNANAISLYTNDGVQLTDDEIGQLTLKLRNAKKIKNMKLLAAHLQLSEQSSEAQILEAVKGLEAKLTAASDKRDEYKQKLDTIEAENLAKLKATYNANKSEAIKDGRLNADDDAVKTLDEIAETEPDKAIKLIAGLPKRQNVAGSLGKSNKDLLADFDKMTWDELDKGGHLITLKAEHGDYYIARFKKQFGVEPKK